MRINSRGPVDSSDGDTIGALMSDRVAHVDGCRHPIEEWLETVADHCMTHALPSGRSWRGALVVLLLALSSLPLHGADASVALAEFKATAQINFGILVYWETATEFETIAFTLTRAESALGPWEDPINQQAALGDGITGAVYTYLDTDVVAGTIYYYILTEIPVSGEGGVFGPISAVMGLAGTATPTRTPAATATQGSPLAGTQTMTATATRTRTPTPSVTVVGDQESLPPTVTRQFTNTPEPTFPGTPVVASPEVPTPPSAPAATASAPVVLATPTSGAAVPSSVPLPLVPTSASVPGISSAAATATRSPTAAPHGPEARGAPATVTSATPPIFEARSTSQPLVGSDRPRATSTPDSDGQPSGRTRFILALGAVAIVIALLLVAAMAAIRRRRRS